MESLINRIGQLAIEGESLDERSLPYKCCAHILTNGTQANCLTPITKQVRKFTIYRTFRDHMYSEHSIDVMVACKKSVEAKISSEADVEEDVASVPIVKKVGKKEEKIVTLVAGKTKVRYLTEDLKSCTKEEYDRLNANDV